MSTAHMQSTGDYPIQSQPYSSPRDPRGYSPYLSEQHDREQDVYARSSAQQRDARRAAASPDRQQDQYRSPNDGYMSSPQSHQVQSPVHSAAITQGQRDGQMEIPSRITSDQHNSPALSNTSRQRYEPSQYPQYQDENTRDMARDDTDTGSRSHRKGPHSPAGVQQPTSTKERGHEPSTHTYSRSEAATLAPPTHPGIMRENSEVINRVIVSDPAIDEERMRARIAEAQPMQPSREARNMGLTQEGYEEDRPTQKRQDYSKQKRREVQFGEYVLGQTLGEGEFGKVKLGWKRDGSSQVAIKLIRRESVATNPTRLPKIYREISILRELAHPNIVRLHEMVETERHIGIILEYASGGELFDHILNQRYLKDPSARRLFAQLISGVGYLHKKGIVHRDLKLENLLLDQNKNIIITDFGFANTFDPADELSSQIEKNLGNKEFVKKYRLDKQDSRGLRRGDLMQTSCGSPCYAAPELVVSDSLYTGRKVDVWSCGVILYAMLAGYLPFDDDPANPEGDNINLLYKYITSTPLTFPEYVTPHARDLLRRILVADPRKRADLFEVARHSWLTEYHHVVAHITSSTTNVADIMNTSVQTQGKIYTSQSGAEVANSVVEDEGEQLMNRSASVRIPPVVHSPRVAQNIDHVLQEEPRQERTRHTLQAEYVPPRQHTERVGQDTMQQVQPQAQAQVVSSIPSGNAFAQKPLPQEPSNQQMYNYSPPSQPVQDHMQPHAVTASPPQSIRDAPYQNSSLPQTTTYTSGPVAQTTTTYTTRPTTQGSVTNAVQPTRSDLRLPSRGSYGQPAAPTIAATTVHGQVTQPGKTNQSNTRYNISSPQYRHGATNSIGQSMADPIQQENSMQPPPPPSKGHKRSSTLGSIGEKLFGRSNSSRRQRKDDGRQTNGKKYPPTAMKNPYPADADEPRQSRTSVDSKRSFSFGLRKRSSRDQGSDEEKRRSNILPNSISQRLFGSRQDKYDDASTRTYTPEEQQRRDFSQPESTISNYHQDQMMNGDALQERPNPTSNFSRPSYGHRTQPSTGDVYGSTGVYNEQQQFSRQPVQQNDYGRGYGHGQYNQYNQQPSQNYEQSGRSSMGGGRNVLSKNRRFNDAYEQDGRNGGGSGAVKKVQDFFRRRRTKTDGDYQ